MSGFKTNNRFLKLSLKNHWGIAALLFLLALLLCVRYGLPFLSSGIDESQNQELAKEWQAYLQMTADSGNSHHILAGFSTDSFEKTAERFPFNPNTISKKDLIRLGLPMRTVYTWLHYREKGGHFYKKTDLKKLYTLSESDYERLAPYVQLPEKENDRYKYKKATQPEHFRQAEKKAIPLNKADTQLLKSLTGIGSVLAGRIVAFREALGGFYSTNQLREVYHLPDSVFEKNKKYFRVNPALIKKLNLNDADYKTLSRNPYLRPYARAILKLRKKTGKFSDISQIRQISLINEQKYRKIAPYLTL